MLQDTEKFWAGEFGDAYLQRNQLEWEKRIPFWDHIVDMTYAFSFLEVGCNAGWNLKALREISPSMTLCGVDINESAVKEARDGAGFTVWNQSAGEPFGHRNFDLVFTAGLLIHIPTDLKLIDTGLLDKESGFDSCTYWLLKRP